MITRWPFPGHDLAHFAVGLDDYTLHAARGVGNSEAECGAEIGTKHAARDYWLPEDEGEMRCREILYDAAPCLRCQMIIAARRYRDAG